MHTTAFKWAAGLALITTAHAGTANLTGAPVPGGTLWEWFAGGSIGYLTQLGAAMPNLQAGVGFPAAATGGSHAIYLEVGFTQDDASFAYSPAPGVVGGRTENAAVSLDIIPLTINYKFEAPVTERLNYYLGLGLGLAILDSSYDWNWTQPLAPPNDAGGGSNERIESRLYGNVFAGLAYRLSDTLKVTAGVRYIFMDEAHRRIDVTNVAGYFAGINHDVLIELGARYYF